MGVSNSGCSSRGSERSFRFWMYFEGRVTGVPERFYVQCEKERRQDNSKMLALSNRKDHRWSRLGGVAKIRSGVLDMLRLRYQTSKWRRRIGR